MAFRFPFGTEAEEKKDTVLDHKLQAELNERTTPPLRQTMAIKLPPVVKVTSKTEEKEEKGFKKPETIAQEKYDTVRINTFIECQDFAGLFKYLQACREDYFPLASQSAAVTYRTLKPLEEKLQHTVEELRNKFSSEFQHADKAAKLLHAMFQFVWEIAYEEEADRTLDHIIANVRRDVLFGKLHPQKLELSAELARVFAETPHLAIIFAKVILKKLELPGIVNLIHRDMLDSMKALEKKDTVLENKEFHDLLDKMIGKLQGMQIATMDEEEQMEFAMRLSMG